MKTKEIAEDAIVGREDFFQIQIMFSDEKDWHYGRKFKSIDEAKKWFYDQMAKGLLIGNMDGSMAKYRIVRQMTVQMLEVDLVK